MKKYLAIKNNYVINAFIWDGTSAFDYPDKDCKIVEDTYGNVGIGMYYEEAENVFYYPNTMPPDAPDEIKYIWE